MRDRLAVHFDLAVGLLVFNVRRNEEYGVMRHPNRKRRWLSWGGRVRLPARDERRVSPADDARLGGRGGLRKDTKRWCRGVVGREHDRQAVRDHSFTFSECWIWRCRACGKIFDRYWVEPGRSAPDWMPGTERE
jgi:hypothetical protein